MSQVKQPTNQTIRGVTAPYTNEDRTMNIGNVVEGYEYIVDYPAFLEWVKDYPMILGHPLAYWDNNEVVLGDVFQWQYGDTVTISPIASPSFSKKLQLFTAYGLFSVNGYKMAMGGVMPVKFMIKRQDNQEL